MSSPSQEHLAARISRQSALDITVTKEVVILSKHHDVTKATSMIIANFGGTYNKNE
jgi:hypothetical protein